MRGFAPTHSEPSVRGRRLTSFCYGICPTLGSKSKRWIPSKKPLEVLYVSPLPRNQFPARPYIRLPFRSRGWSGNRLFPVRRREGGSYGKGKRTRLGRWVPQRYDIKSDRERQRPRKAGGSRPAGNTRAGKRAPGPPCPLCFVQPGRAGGAALTGALPGAGWPAFSPWGSAWPCCCGGPFGLGGCRCWR